MKDKEELKFEKDAIKTAILVDGGFYRKRAKNLFGNKSPKERAQELQDYCNCLMENKFENRFLYRVFYYDCPPSDKNVYHPFTKRSVKLKDSDEYAWMNDFIIEIKKLRKFALRLGRVRDDSAKYNLKYDVCKKLFNNSLKLEEITQDDFQIDIQQKGVDMRVGVDITSLSIKKQVNQIILISGDSDFVPAAKNARREGIDFILDPMGSHVNDDLLEHIDGLQTAYKRTRFKNYTKSK